MIIKNNLLEILTKEGITQATLAKESDLASGTINRYCSKSKSPTLVNQNKIVNTINKIVGREKYSLHDIFC